MATGSKRNDGSTLRRALLKIEQMQARLERAERPHREPIAITGIGCRFPGGADDPDAFWALLRDGVDTVEEMRAGRWEVSRYYDPDPDAPGKMSTRWGAFLRDVVQFDAHFFGISPREAVSMDPQQRLLLEVAWEALEHAGHAPDTLSGSRTGVFLGICKSDYKELQLCAGDPDRHDVYYASGSAHSIAAGRLSYVFGFQGPCVAVDTACSSSLVALHLGCNSLRFGEADMVLVGGVNLMLSPENTITYSKAGMMSVDGRCKTFDAAANGFVQGEGCGVVVLKRLDDALAAGDRVLAVIRGSAVNQDGASSGITAPNGPAQVAVIRQALANAGVEPRRVGFVEAHGTGTSLGDPIEVQALAAALADGRPSTRPLLLGALKTNIGHLEAAAGIAGLVKVVMCLQNRRLPATLHLNERNPLIDWDAMPLAIPTELTEWPAVDGERIAGLSSFGFSGTNAHVIVGEAPARRSDRPADDRPVHVACVSAKKEAALEQLTRDLAAALDGVAEDALPDVCHTLNCGRAHHPHRFALVSESLGETRSQLAALSRGDAPRGVFAGRSDPADRCKVAFLFTGQGAQYAGMGRALYETQPTFRAALEECVEALRGHLEHDLLSVMFPDAETAGLLDETAYTQPALVSVEYALARLWQSWGVSPSAVMGHSVGEYAAACVAGACSLQDGLALIAERGRLMQSMPRGAMAALFAEPDQVFDAVDGQDSVTVAAINGPREVVISGVEEAVDGVLRRMSDAGVRGKRLTVSHAFHSPLVDGMLDGLEAAAARLSFRRADVTLVSNLTGDAVGADIISQPSYWRRHAREPVRFAEGIAALARRGYRVFLEIGPHPTLIRLGQLCLDADDHQWIPSLRKGCDDWQQMSTALAALYTAGADIDWAGYDRGYDLQTLTLPRYPFQRRRYWFSASSASAAAGQVGVRGPEADRHPLLGRCHRSPLIREALFETELAADSLPFVADHRVHDRVILPATAYLEMALAAAAEVLGTDRPVIRDLDIREALILPEAGARTLQVVLIPKDGETEVRIISKRCEDPPTPESWTVHTTGVVGVEAPHEVADTDIDALRRRLSEYPLPIERFYRELEGRGLDLGGTLRGVAELWSADNEALGRIELAAAVRGEISRYRVHPAALDACVQVVAAALLAGSDAPASAYMPFGVGAFRVHDDIGRLAYSHVHVDVGEGRAIGADVRLLDGRGRLLAEIEQLRLVPAAVEDLLKEQTHDDWLYEIAWREAASDDEGTAAPRPLVLPADVVEPVGERLPGLRDEHDIEAYDRLLPQLDALSAGYVARALQQLGFRFEPGNRLRATSLRLDLGIAPRFERPLLQLLRTLVAEGALKRREDGWEVTTAGVVDDPDGLRKDLSARFPDGRAELQLVARVGGQLAGVLSGATDPLELLFPGGSVELAEHLYEGSPTAKLFNTLAAGIARRYVDAVANGTTVRILEIGAGTGGTAGFLLPQLAGQDIEYTFTDLSQSFLAKARRKFADHPFVRYEVLDISSAPESQGFAPGYDMVVATNVLHATTDVRSTLRHVARLLAPGGMLLLLENTRAQGWIDMTFGLTEGWWHFNDFELRASHPLLSREQWSRLLPEEGFGEVAVVPDVSPGDGTLARNALFLARRTDADEREDRKQAEQGRWLLFADRGGVGEALAAEMQRRGEACTLVFDGDAFARANGRFTIDAGCDADYRRLLDDVGALPGGVKAVVHLWALDRTFADAGAELPTTMGDVQRRACGSVLRLVKAVAGRPQMEDTALRLVTRGAQAVYRADQLEPAQASLWGLAKVIALEHPELRCACIDIDPLEGPEEQARLLRRELRRDDGEDQIAVRDGAPHVPRLVRCRRGDGASPSTHEKQPRRVAIGEAGSLDGLALCPLERRDPGVGEVEIRVHAAGLNFRDLMNVLGMRSDDDPFGSECAGVVTAVGEGVSSVAVGDAVVAVAPGAFGSFVTADAELVLPMPRNIDFSAAATIPLAFLTAHYALHTVGEIGAGDRVLIHAAAGGVGMAAVQLARRAGAEVFATAGKPRKRAYLRSLGIEHVMDSRSLDFADEVLTATGGEGVDLVLNSLTGEAIPRGLSLLRDGGRFLEIGKAEIWDQERAATVNPAARYVAVDLSERLQNEPAMCRTWFAALLGDVEDGSLTPLPYEEFDLEDAAAAFRSMARARHIGKVVLSVADAAVGSTVAASSLVAEATYLITGGLGGLGLQVAVWMVEHGARHLVLMGRRGAARPEAREAVDDLRGRGVDVKVIEGDVSSAADVERLGRSIDRTGLPLRGVVHAAGVLDDGLLLQQTWDRFANVFAPKVFGSWNLHRLTRHHDLDFFVLFSSVSAVIATAGQGNHAAANAFLDALAHYRRSLGLPGLSINWGVWRDIGATVEHDVEARIQGSGMRSFSVEDGMRVFETLLSNRRRGAPDHAPQVGVMPVDWSIFTRTFRRSSFYEELAPDTAAQPQAVVTEGAPCELRLRIEEAPPRDRRKLVQQHVLACVRRILDIDDADEIDPREPLTELGLDSLMAVELRGLLSAGLGLERNLPSTLVFDYPSVADLTEFLAADVLRLTESAERPSATAGDASALDAIEQLSDEEVEAFFNERIGRKP